MASVKFSNLVDPSVPFSPPSLRRSEQAWPPSQSSISSSIHLFHSPPPSHRRSEQRLLVAPWGTASLAPCAAVCFDSTAFLDRRRGSRMACGVMAGEPARTQKRARDSLDGKTCLRDSFAAGKASVVPAPGQQRLQERMKAELEAVRELHKKAVLLCRGAGRSGAAPAAKGDARFSTAGPRREASLEAAAKRRKMEVAHQIKKPVKQQPRVQRATAPRLQERKTKKTDEEVQRTRRMEEIARAREECRRQVLEMEMAALPDETIYPQDLEELGIADEYVVTRTRSQALSQDRILVGVA
ncbi:hypothetical protein PAHAL_3G288900 [Panicum hallii]|uniref:Uncharacterized protein n=1 Tax=Panicum hallii TaxID=206008 RepID=A0A2T8KJR5_9POAL|nr:hypothetical protein PAHAL_3G288900 [Panicum hallii]